MTFYHSQPTQVGAPKVQSLMYIIDSLDSALQAAAKILSVDPFPDPLNSSPLSTVTAFTPAYILSLVFSI